MSNTRTILAAAIALVVAATACSDTTEPPEMLTEQEARDLLDGYRTLLLEDDPNVISETAGGILVECPLGGRAEVTGSGDEVFVGDTARLQLNVSINPMSCRVAANGNEFTITGDPNIREEISVEIVGFFDRFDVSGTTAGGVAWEMGDRSGTCEVDLELQAEPDLTDPENPGVSGTLNGMLCGHEVSIDVAELPIE